MPESDADQCTDGGHEDHSHAIDFDKYFKKYVDYKSLQYYEKFRWQLGDDSLNVSNEFPGLGVACGRPDRGLSAKRPVSRKRSIVATLIPK